MLMKTNIFDLKHENEDEARGLLKEKRELEDKLRVVNERMEILNSREEMLQSLILEISHEATLSSRNEVNE